MTPDEALKLCRLAKAISPAQAVDDYTPDAWAVVLRDIRYADAEDALGQLGSEQEWIHVSHIVGRVKRIRADRVKRYFANVSPPSGLSDTEYADWYRETVTAIGDGDLTPEPPTRVEGHRDVIRELGHVGQSVDEALRARESITEAKRVLQEAEADRKRAEDARRADLERVRREEEAARQTPADPDAGQRLQDEIRARGRAGDEGMSA